ncbi:unnamed protein product [[Candida] boidinii]|nr:unnamed protein product [[Candida] boidinii]
MVQEKLHPAKIQVDPKTGKPLKDQSSNNSPLIEEDKGSSFFGGFFTSKNKKRLASMEAPPNVLRATGAMTDRETQETEVIKLLIQSYFNIVKRTVADIIPKSIMLKLINESKIEIQKVLLEKLYNNKELENLVKENEVTTARRKECQKMVEVLKHASEIVSTV